MDAWLEVLDARGAALVPEWLAGANRAVGNAWDTAALECYGRLTLRVHGRGAWVSLGAEAFRVEPGGIVPVPQPEMGVVRYVAVEGGLALPEVLGGRGTLPVARLGGMEGRALRAGDVLPLGTPGGGAREAGRGTVALDAEVRVVLGPDLGRFGTGAAEVLLESVFTVSPTSDRVGMRLLGVPLPQADGGSGPSGPLVRGSIQVPSSGEAIVLGPDHPTLGGYPVLAVVIRADWGRLAARRPGATVRFLAVGVDEARDIWRRQTAGGTGRADPGG